MLFDSNAEVILLLQEQRIEKQMLLQEFDAVLNRVVSVTELKNQTCRAVYLQVDRTLQIRACVLFVISFDDSGNSPENWNLPFAQLSENAGKGPNLGAGFIKLSCSGQCSVPWHNNKLWSPDDFPDVFILAQKAVVENLLNVEFVETGEVPYDVSSNAYDMDGYSHEETRFIDGDTVFDVQDSIEVDRVTPEKGSDLINQQWRHKLEVFEKEYKQKLQDIDSNADKSSTKIRDRYEQRLLCVTEEYEKTLEEITRQLAQVKVRLDTISSQKKSLEDINHSQKKNIDGLQEKIDAMRKQFEQKNRDELQMVSQKYEADYAENLNDINKKWTIELEKKEEEIRQLSEQLIQLRKDICDLRRDKIRLVNSGADKFLENLERLGINFIAFHPGAGHMSIPLVDMSLYMDGPITYAANRCMVSEDHYRLWLQHYESPICRFQMGKDKEEICGCRIKRVDVPKAFKSGATDRCVKHPSVSADWGKVINLSS